MAVVVDSAASLPTASETPGLHVVPMGVTIDGTTYLDGRDLEPSAFYAKLRESKDLPKTSAPSPARFLEAFEAAKRNVGAILCLTVGARFSASLDAARAAVEEAKASLPGLEVIVLDSESAAGGQGLIALEAWRAARGGAELDEVVATAREVIPRVRVVAFLDTLYYLWKGGRVPRIAHAGASLLRIKPLFEMARGRVFTVARPRTQRRAVNRLLELVSESAEGRPVHATVMHADALEAAEDLRWRLAAMLPCEELFVSEFTPAMGAHIGPGLVGIAYWT